jgi:hypothetical protein
VPDERVAMELLSEKHRKREWLFSEKTQSTRTNG